MSEVVAFVLSFSVIIVSVGIVYTAGIGSLTDLQAKEQTANAEQVFLAVGDSFGELQEGQAPKRAGSLDLDIGATIGVINQSEMNVTVGGASFTRTIRTRSLRYEIDETIVAYENGGVFRSDHGHSAMLGPPPEMYCSNSTDSAIVSIVRLRSEHQPSAAAGTVTIIGIQESTELLFPDSRTGPPVSGVENVSVNVSSPHEEAWKQHFENNRTDWVDPDDDDTYTCQGVGNVFIRKTVIEVRIVS